MTIESTTISRSVRRTVRTVLESKWRFVGHYPVTSRNVKDAGIRNLREA